MHNYIWENLEYFGNNESNKNNGNNDIILIVPIVLMIPIILIRPLMRVPGAICGGVRYGWPRRIWRLWTL